ncbi:MAG: malectin domain-containing carbohydrate-binding protein [Candidatus Acidiferrales bacterium]
MRKNGMVVYGLSLAVLLLAASFPALAQVNYTTQHNDLSRTGDNLSETTLNQSNVNANTFGMLWKVSVDDEVYATPLYVHGLTVNGATHNVVYVATVNNSVYAFDADTGGTALWHTNYGTPTNHTVVGQGGCGAGAYNDFQGNIGIVGTPVIDTSNDEMFFVAHTMVSGTHTQTLYAINILTGATVKSVVITATGFNSTTNNQRPAITLYNGNVYIAWSSYCDTTPYDGFIMAYSESALTQVAVFNDTSTGTQGGIWQAGQGLNVDSSGNIYVMTGNGTWDGSKNFGESFVKLNPSNLTEEDYFTPADWSTLNGGDVDLGAAGGLLIPGTNLIVGGGKAGIFYLLNTGNMGHETTGDTGVVQEFQVSYPNPICDGYIHGGPAYYDSSSLGQLIYIWAQNDYLHEFKFNGSTFPSTVPYADSPLPSPPCGEPGVMMSISANGNTDSTAILWGNEILSGDANHTTVPGVIRAFNATNVNQELWDSQQDATRDSCNNFAKDSYPVVVNGKVYLASFGTATAGSGQLCAYGLLSTTCNTPTTPGTLSATSPSNSQVNLSWGASTSSCTVSYNVYRSTTSGFTPSSSNLIAQDVFATTYSDTNAAPATTYYYLVEAVAVTTDSAQSNQATVTTGAAISSIEIDSGSTTAVSPFVADEYYSAFNDATTDHANTINTSNVTNPAPAAVYQSGRDGVFSYTIPGFVAGSSHVVRLHFCETYWTAIGQRVFNVSINGTPVLTNFDIFKTAGGQNIANIQQFTENANANGQFVIQFTSVVNNSLINGIEIDASTGSCSAAPTAPSGLGATAVSSSQINLTWTASTAGTGCTITYNVYQSTTSGFTPSTSNEIASGLTTTSYSATGLAASTTYYYLTEAVDSFGSSTQSNQASATTSAASCAAAPTAPSGLGATAISSSQINLSWTASTAGTGCTITYNVYSSTTSGFTPSTSNEIASGVTTTTYSNTGLAASTTYYYLVEAVDSFGSSGPSNQASATTSASSGSCTSICINSGGPLVSPFVADEDFTGGGTITHTNTIDLSHVTNPAPMAVYQKGRDGNFTYTIGGFTANSMHTVRLHFAETYWTACAKRTFNVSINSTSVLTDFDIYCTAGGENIANIQQFSEAANSSGQYVIVFTTVVNNSLVNGIEID